MAWQTPVCDRTAEDVAAGADSCYFNAGTLNRIEGNIAVLAERFGVQVHTKTWVDTDFLTPSEWQRVLDDLQTVRDAYVSLPGLPPVPALPATLWSDVNDIERILWEQHDLWARNRAHADYAGELAAGGGGIL